MVIEVVRNLDVGTLNWIQCTLVVDLKAGALVLVGMDFQNPLR